MIKNKIIKISKKAFFLAESPTLVAKNNLAWIDIYKKKLLILNLISKKIKQKKFKIFKQNQKPDGMFFDKKKEIMDMFFLGAL